MKFKPVRVYRCRNCGEEIIKEDVFPYDSDEEKSFLGFCEYKMSVSNGCYAFFHECSEMQIGYCELIRREIENKELERQKSRLKAKIKNIDMRIRDE